MAKSKKNDSIIKKILIFREPEKKKRTVIDENLFDEKSNPKGYFTKKKRSLVNRSLFNKNKDIKKKEEFKISRKLDENLEYIKKKYSIPINGDLKLREFIINFNNKMINAFIIFFDGMTDRNIINKNILLPIMMLSNRELKNVENDLSEYIGKQLLPQNQLIISSSMNEVINQTNFGGCALFVDGCDKCFIADVKGWEHRSVDRPNMELVIRGPQEGFNEILRSNNALIRKIITDSDLIAEDISIGKRSNTACSLMYIKSIANEQIVNEARKRLKGIDVDYIIDIGEIEQLIEDYTYMPTPQIIATERPDRVAASLSEGKVAIMMNGSPYALIIPTTLTSLFHSPEDSYVRFPYSNLFRIIRVIGVLSALLLPAFYIAITNYHHEMIPTDLLLAISASREKVPFPSIIEILIMEISFELIREAGIRIPGPIGPTLGIIGALILGQAAVAANVVSPILIIIVAVTGIGSFTIPNYSLAFTYRIIRFGYIILGYLAGILGITVGIFIHLIMLCRVKSFGVPFLAPFGPITKDLITDQITRAPIWKQERRPDYLNTKSDRKQEHISRKWTLNKEDKGE